MRVGMIKIHYVSTYENVTMKPIKMWGKKERKELGIAVHTCNPNTWETAA
jgi:hypothetical protein